MFRIGLEEFEQLKEVNGVYIFSEKDGCSLCTRFIEMLNKDYSVDDWYLIELGSDKLDYVRETYSFNGFPSTVFYHYDEIKWKKSGALFSVQLRSLNKTINEYSNNEKVYYNLHDLVDFDYQTATKKPLPVKCFQLKNEIVVNTLGDDIRGTRGDWFVLDGIEPCIVTDKEFKNTYEIEEIK